MTFRNFTFALAASLCLLGNAHADQGSAGTMTRKGGAFVSPPARTAAAVQPASLGVVFSNFGKPTAPFQGGGMSVNGPANATGYGKQFVAVPFVPKQNATLAGIAVAVNRDPSVITQRGVRVVLYTDAAGIPGTVVQSWPVDPVGDGLLGNFSYITAGAKSGLALAAGTTYWVAVETDAGSDFYGWWAYNVRDTSGPTAYWNDSTATWTPVDFISVPALAVYGSAR